ncbi:hypothetical protein [Streptomyces sp. WAC06614]|uniref:hypothetical protein n=1 Tax=Streptomyces sp. WAC06614 TaxID=2487416 RepID=UPI000F79998B|nr:hypothetical protein [Streptomyces sp. WAC06614]RSS62693.1 hypothetical protein EF918_31210 [Streptomyces sp. WAC06614]
MNNVRKRAVIAAGAVLAGVGLAFPAVALAEDGGRPAPSQDKQEQKHDKRAEQRADRQKELAEALAKDLGVPVEKVTGSLEKFRAAQREQHAQDHDRNGGGQRHFKDGQRPDAEALQKKLAERLAQAVKDGKITQAQADAILAAAKAGALPGPFGGPHGQGK